MEWVSKNVIVDVEGLGGTRSISLTPFGANGSLGLEKNQDPSERRWAVRRLSPVRAPANVGPNSPAAFCPYGVMRWAGSRGSMNRRENDDDGADDPRGFVPFRLCTVLHHKYAPPMRRSRANTPTMTPAAMIVPLGPLGVFDGEGVAVDVAGMVDDDVPL